MPLVADSQTLRPSQTLAAAGALYFGACMRIQVGSIHDHPDHPMRQVGVRGSWILVWPSRVFPWACPLVLVLVPVAASLSQISSALASRGEGQ